MKLHGPLSIFSLTTIVELEVVNLKLKFCRFKWLSLCHEALESSNTIGRNLILLNQAISTLNLILRNPRQVSSPVLCPYITPSL